MSTILKLRSLHFTSMFTRSVWLCGLYISQPRRSLKPLCQRAASPVLPPNAQFQSLHPKHRLAQTCITIYNPHTNIPLTSSATAPSGHQTWMVTPHTIPGSLPRTTPGRSLQSPKPPPQQRAVAKTPSRRLLALPEGASQQPGQTPSRWPKIAEVVS